MECFSTLWDHGDNELPSKIHKLHVEESGMKKNVPAANEQKEDRNAAKHRVHPELII